MSVVEIVDAASISLYINGPAGVYSATNNRTYIAYLGLDRDLYVTYYDHMAGTVATPVKADTRLIAANNDHSAPSICIDGSGYLHISWGSHNSAIQHVKSNSPHDILAWTDSALTASGTYTQIRVNPANDHLYIFYRAGSGHGSSMPAHEYAAFVKSTDGGSTWSSESAVIDTTGTTESHSDAYLMGVIPDSDGKFHLGWTVARGTSHDDTRINVYHAIFDPSDDTLDAVDGTDLGSTIDWSEHASCLAHTQTPTNVLNLWVDGTTPIISWRQGTSGAGGIVHWAGSEWRNFYTFIPNVGTVYKVGSSYRFVTSVDGNDDGVRDLELRDVPGLSQISDPAGLQSGSQSTGFRNHTDVLAYGPGVSLWQEQATTEPNGVATASDLMPIYLVVDEGIA